MSKIKVFVRIRPSLPGEFDQPGVTNVIQMEDVSGNWVQVKKDGEQKRYFARCWGPASQQEDVYRVVGVPTVNDVFEGFFGTIFVYGQTGTGKSYTLGCLVPGIEGILPRAFQHMFDKIKKEANKYEVEAQMQYVQLYRDDVQDLLNPVKDKLVLRVEAEGCIIEQVTSRVVTSFEEGLALIKEGDANRVVANTKMNSASSRSHACAITEIRRKNLETGQSTLGKLYLIDLAGSERVSKSGVTGDALKEAVSINKSLTVLGNCIAGIVAGEKNVAFRDSKLTRVLQHSLSGHGRTSIIVTIRPDSLQIQETLCTLKFAERAQKVEAQMTPASFRDQMLDMMLKVSDVEQEIADKVASSEANRALSIQLKEDCMAKDDELAAAEVEAKEKVAEAAAAIQGIKDEMELQFQKDAREIVSKTEDEMQALKKANASILKEIEEKVAAAVAEATKKFKAMQKERTEKIESAKNKGEVLTEKVAKLKPIPSETVDDIVEKKKKEINDQAALIRSKIRATKLSPNQGLSAEEVEAKYELFQDILLRVEDKQKELHDFLTDNGWDMKRIEKKAQQPTEEEIEKYLKEPPPAPESENSDSAPPTESDSGDSDSTSSSSEEEEEKKKEEEPKKVPEKENPDDKIIERQNFDSATKKNVHLDGLTAQIMHYLEYGCLIHRLRDYTITREFMFLGKDSTILCVCEYKDGQPDRRNASEMYRVSDVAEVVLGQAGGTFRDMLQGRKPVNPEFKMPTNSSAELTVSNVEQYVYRSLTIHTKKGTSLEFVCDTDAELEAWTLAFYRLAQIEPVWSEKLNLDGYEETKLLTDDEKKLCSRSHITPLAYLRTKEETVGNPKLLFITLYDVRMSLTLDLMTSQKVFSYYQKCGWLEKDNVYHLKYRDNFLHAKNRTEEFERRRAQEVAIREASKMKKSRLRGMFKKYRIDAKDGKLSDLLKAYNNNEEVIIKALVEKYGPEPDPDELAELLKPPDSKQSKGRRLYKDCVMLQFRVPAPQKVETLLKYSECTEEKYQALCAQYPLGPQIEDDPIVVHSTGPDGMQRLAYYDREQKKEFFLEAFRQIFVAISSKMFANVQELHVPMEIDPILKFLSQDPKEVDVAQHSLKAINTYCRDVASAGYPTYMELCNKCPGWIGTLHIDISDPTNPILFNLQKHSTIYYDALQAVFEDIILQQYESVYEMLMVLRKRVLEKRPGMTISPPPTPAMLIEKVFVPWLDVQYASAQDAFLKDPPRDLLSQQVKDMLEGKYFGGITLEPGELPPQAPRATP